MFNKILCVLTLVGVLILNPMGVFAQKSIEPFIGIGTNLNASYAKTEKAGLGFSGLSQTVMLGYENPNITLGVEMDEKLLYIQVQSIYNGTSTKVELDAPNNNRNESYYKRGMFSQYLNLSLFYSFRPIPELNWNLLIGVDYTTNGRNRAPLDKVFYGISTNDALYPYADTTKRTFIKGEQLGLNLGIQKMLFPEKRFSIVLSAYYRRGFGVLFKDELSLFYNSKRYQTNFVSTGSFFAINATAIYRIRL